MPLKVFAIQINDKKDERQAHFPGETLTGRVLLTVDTQEIISCVKLTFIGGEYTMLTKEKRKGDDDNVEVVTVEGKTLLVDETSFLAGDKEPGRIQLNAGKKYAFPFQFVVPFDCPSTGHISSHAFVEYLLHAEVERHNEPSYNAFENPIIISSVDCNSPELLQVKQVGKDYDVGCLCFGKGSIHLQSQIPVSGFTAGERIPLSIEINNPTSSAVSQINILFQRNVHYTAQGLEDHESHHLDSQSFPVTAGQPHMDCSVIVPSDLTCTTFHGSLMQVDYLLVIIAVVDGLFSDNARQDLPIFIGNIPRKEGPPVEIVNEPENPIFSVVPHSIISPSNNDEKQEEGGEVDEWPSDIPPAYNDQTKHMDRTMFLKSLSRSKSKEIPVSPMNLKKSWSKSPRVETPMNLKKSWSKSKAETPMNLKKSKSWSKNSEGQRS
jgi:hypothetical protein